MDKRDVVYPYHEILFSKENEQWRLRHMATWMHLQRAGQTWSWWELDSSANGMYDHIYINLKMWGYGQEVDQRSLETGTLSGDAHQLGENVSRELHWIMEWLYSYKILLNYIQMWMLTSMYAIYGMSIILQQGNTKPKTDPVGFLFPPLPSLPFLSPPLHSPPLPFPSVLLPSSSKCSPNVYWTI